MEWAAGTITPRYALLPSRPIFPWFSKKLRVINLLVWQFEQYWRKSHDESDLVEARAHSGDSFTVAENSYFTTTTSIQSCPVSGWKPCTSWPTWKGGGTIGRKVVVRHFPCAHIHTHVFWEQCFHWALCSMRPTSFECAQDCTQDQL